MKHLLLLGAGFSHNWGGWLASEAFEYLLGCQQIDTNLRDLLWQHRKRGGFEAALEELQESEPAGERLSRLQDAIRTMFEDMDQGFQNQSFEFQRPPVFREFTVQTFLDRFDAIFTLNQDLLLERFYLNSVLSQRWTACVLPGMRPIPGLETRGNRFIEKWTPVEQSEFTIHDQIQPYFKLHGSVNWVDSDSKDLLILGGNKASAIARFPILAWIHEEFVAHLAQPNTRLMIIGYSFGDDHINAKIRQAVRNGRLGIFLVDPVGVDVVDANRGAAIHSPATMAADI